MKCRVMWILAFPGRGAEDDVKYGFCKNLNFFFLLFLRKAKKNLLAAFLCKHTSRSRALNPQSTVVQKYQLEKCRNRSLDYSLCTGNPQLRSAVLSAQAHTVFSKCESSSLQSVLCRVPPDKIEERCEVLPLHKVGSGESKRKAYFFCWTMIFTEG